MSGQKLWRFWYCLNQRHEGLLFEETSKIIQKWNFITLILWQVFAKIICAKFKYNYTNVRLRNKKSFFIQICFGILFHLRFSLKITQCTSSKLYFLETAIFELVSYFQFLIFCQEILWNNWIFNIGKSYKHVYHMYKTFVFI